MQDTQPLKVSKKLHQRLKTAASSRGMKLQELADVVVKSWLDKQTFKK